MNRFSFLAAFCVLALAQPSFGQGLLFNLPPDGSWISYEGTVKQTDQRPDPETGQLKTAADLNWIRQLTIRSVGSEMAEFRGQMQPCRWIEIDAVTGVKSEIGAEPGLVGRRVYKILVPESVIDGKARDNRGVPTDMIPIVKGFKQLRTNAPIQPIKSPALRVYPNLSLLAHYSDPKVELASGNPGVPLRNGITGKQLSGAITIERLTSRLSNTAKFWVSDELPFGLASWEVTMTRESKGVTDPRSSFAQVSTIEVEMKAAREGNDAEAVIPDK